MFLNLKNLGFPFSPGVSVSISSWTRTKVLNMDLSKSTHENQQILNLQHHKVSQLNLMWN